ncbi:uncharacterized protein LOC143037509 [Oratosquilla oratoria]|uniref:uncharacterized protein LOC143037509 n=1 Tax=Oratosquilla oratoria TaxID=337810 RepID=UPI003F75EE9B
MLSFTMSRWVRGAVWCAGAGVVWCPVCVCISGGGSWWVCACAVGLIAVTLGSGYTAWTVFTNLLRHGPSSYPLFAWCVNLLERLVERSHDLEVKKSLSEERSTGKETAVNRELTITAHQLYSGFIFPWYSQVSPDNHFSHQMKDLLEGILVTMCWRVRESVCITKLISEVIQLYIQHYRQYYKAIRKVARKHGEEDPSVYIGCPEISTAYKSLHPALKSADAEASYYRKLSHILLHNYLPLEVSRCDLIFICLRDLFAQNVLKGFVDQVCDTQWLNTLIAEILSDPESNDTDSDGTNQSHSPSKAVVPHTPSSVIKSRDSEKLLVYTNPLASIQEETISDLQTLEGSPGRKASVVEPSEQRGPSGKGGELHGPCRFENVEALVKYMKSSSLEKKDSKEDEDYPTLSSALSKMISTTAGPLLPDNSASIQYQPIVQKMWESPVEEKKYFVDMPKMKKNPFSRRVVEGMKVDDFKLMISAQGSDSGKRAGEDKTQETAGSRSADTQSSEEEPKSNAKVRNTTLDVSDSDIVDSKPLPHSSKETTTLLALPFDLQRSKSCGSISTDEVKSVHDIPKILHSSLNCLDQFSSNESSGEFKESREGFSDEEEQVMREKGHEKGHLVKMLSFDKNDGIDDESLQQNSGAENLCLQTPACVSSEQVETPIDPADPSGISSLEVPSSPPLHNAGFGWENSDLSPIYEESDDLASSIAKLRSLLSARESQHSLGSLSSYGSSDSEPKSAQSDPGRYNLERPRFTFTHKDSSSSLASVRSCSSVESCGGLGVSTDEELLEAAEIPLDGRVFLQVSIPNTEVHTEPGGTQFTVYVIQYDAIYLLETNSSQGENNEEGSSSVAISEPRMVLQTNHVKRRFREFLTLHAALEEDQRLRTFMKGVKGPNKWLNLPFSKLDSTTIASRKQFLEKYLQAVIQRPEINISLPMKEFLAYGSDASVAFVKKPLELSVPRLDKLLARTVSGVFHSIKTALPSFDSTEGNSSSSSGSITGDSKSTGGGSVGGSSERKMFQGFMSNTRNDYELRLDITAEEEECEIEDALVLEVNGVDTDCPIDSAFEARETQVGCLQLNLRQDPHLQSFPTQGPPGPRSEGDGCDITSLTRNESNEESLQESEDGLWQECPLSTGLLDALVELLTPSDHPLTHQPCVTLLSLFAARMTNTWLQVEIDGLFSEEKKAEYIRRIREAIVAPSAEDKGEEPDPKELQMSKENLIQAIHTFLPNALPLGLGDATVKKGVELLVDSLQHPVLARDLALYLLDLVAAQLVPHTFTP